MSIKRDSKCPLCGAKLSATELLDAAAELIEPRLGVVEAHCPHCQGYLEIMPAPERVEVGYLIGPDKERFDVALTLPLEGLEVHSGNGQHCLTLTAPRRAWTFRE